MSISTYGNLPKISIIMVVRNGAATIGRALDSIALQHYPKLEVIVWDGLSTDGTLDVLKRYPDQITTLISEADSGPPDAYNRALERATGDYIGYLNADDEFEPGMLWAVAEAILRDTQAEVITTGILYRTAGRRGKRIVNGYYAAEEQLALTLANVLSELPTFMLSRFIRRELSLKAGPYNTNRDLWYISCDREWMARLALMPCRQAVVPHALYGFDMHEKSISSNPQAFLKIIKEHLLIAQHLLARTDLSDSQRSIVGRWQRRQCGYGFLKALLKCDACNIRGFFKQGMGFAGWRFLPGTFMLLMQRMTRKLGLLLSGGIDRG